MAPDKGLPIVPGFTEEEAKTKIGFCAQLRGGVIMDVTDADQARIAEKAGAAAVMALERVPADIRKEGGVARMASPRKVQEIQRVVSIPVMAKCRIGHFVEAQILQAMEVDCVDESEVLTPADEERHVWKRDFQVPFVCGCRNLGEALRRIHEGAAMIRTKGEAGTGNIVEAVRHLRAVRAEIDALKDMNTTQRKEASARYRVPLELVSWVADAQRLPVPNFSAGGVATPADAALMMQLGAEAVFVGSGVFKSADPERRARAIVRAVTHYQDPKVLLEVSAELGDAMRGLEMSTIPEPERLAGRGW